MDKEQNTQENEQVKEPNATENKHTELTVDEVVQLKLECDELREQVKEMHDKSLRIAAEAENAKRIARQDADNAKKYALSNFAKELIEPLENFQRVMDNMDKEATARHPELQNLYVGVEMTYKSLLSAFERHKITRFNPLNEQFDYNYHQAVSQVEDDSVQPGTIVQVVKAGYMIEDRLLRPALVAVTKLASSDK